MFSHKLAKAFRDAGNRARALRGGFEFFSDSLRAFLVRLAGGAAVLLAARIAKTRNPELLSGDLMREAMIRIRDPLTKLVTFDDVRRSSLKYQLL
jgi:hypothetical protein